MTDNRKTRRAKESSNKKSANQGQIMILQEGLNKLNARLNGVIEELQHINQFRESAKNVLKDVDKLSRTLSGIDAAVAAIGEIAESKNLFSQSEIQEKISDLFDRQYGLKQTDRKKDYIDDDILFISFCYRDENGKVISERKDPMMYRWGSKNLPAFEENAVDTPVGEMRSVEHTFPDDYHVKKLAGKKVFFEFLIHDLRVKTFDAKTKPPENVKPLNVEGQTSFEV